VCVLKLEIGRIYIKDIQLGQETSVKEGVLTVDKEGLIAKLKEDERIKDVSLDVAKPGEKVRIIPVKDVIEPRVKIEGGNNGFPGVTSKQAQCGEGKTNVLYGAAVVTVGDVVGFQEGVIDMWGEGAKWTPFSKTYNLTVDISVVDGLTPHAHEETVRIAGLKAAEFVGFLHGVPFFWTLHLILPMLVVLGVLLLIYIAFDKYYLLKEKREKKVQQNNEPPQTALESGKTLEILGTQNFALLAAIIGVIIFSGSVKMAEVSILGVHLGLQDVIRNILLVAILVISWIITPKTLREENEYSWAPIQEVAYLFFGIFITMAPVLAILKAGESGALSFITAAVKEPSQYFWITGALSSFLDNAPTYLTFFSTALGQFYPGMPEATAVANLLAEHPTHLMAISASSVFFGAVTYIGNAPNFMVRSISEEAGVPMPSFFGYMVYSICILLPVFGLVTLLFF
jgi:hypothetical protein